MCSAASEPGLAVEGTPLASVNLIARRRLLSSGPFVPLPCRLVLEYFTVSPFDRCRFRAVCRGWRDVNDDAEFSRSFIIAAVIRGLARDLKKVPPVSIPLRTATLPSGRQVSFSRNYSHLRPRGPAAIDEKMTDNMELVFHKLRKSEGPVAFQYCQEENTMSNSFWRWTSQHMTLRTGENVCISFGRKQEDVRAAWKDFVSIAEHEGVAPEHLMQALPCQFSSVLHNPD